MKKKYSIEDVPKEVAFGWGAPKLKDQFPMLNHKEMDRLQEFSKYMISLHLNDYISDSIRDKIKQKLSNKVSKLVREFKKRTIYCDNLKRTKINSDTKGAKK